MVNVSVADKQFLDKLNKIVQEQMVDSQFGVSELAREMGMSRSTLHRKVKEIAGKHVNNLISEARLTRAMELLKQGTLTVSEVAYEVGFASVPYFVKCFHDHFEFTPGEAMNRNVPEITPEDIQDRQIIVHDPKKRIKNILTIGSFIALILISGTWFVHRKIRTKWAIEKALPQIELNLKETDYQSGFDLLQKIRKYVQGNPEFKKLDSLASSFIFFHTDPPGAKIYYKAYSDTTDSWKFMGISPVDSLKVPVRTLYRYKVVRQGYEPVFAVESTGFEDDRRKTYYRKLFPQGTIPEGMVHVVNLLNDTTNDYFIDKYEVTNKQYKDFVDHGGYQKREYWKYPFVRDKDTLTWEAAMQLLTDRTGRPGPSTWEAGDFPDGQEDFPVTGISWYEAAAFADFAGKEIPTENHWKSALGLDYIHSQVLTRSNFQYKGPVKVGLYKGIFAYGTFDMAGNAREWCFNGKDNKQSLLGGAWDDPYYVYLAGALVPAFDRSVKNGFRCVKYIDKTKIPDRFFSSQSSNQTFDSNFWHRVRPVSDEVFRVIKNRFVYNKKDFKAKIEKKDKSPKDWSLELISFNTVYDNKRMVVYLYLPKNISSPFQTVIMYPGFDGFAGSSNDSYAERYSHNYDFIVKSGRALLLPVYYGNLERSKDAVPDSYPGQTVIYWITDFRRTIDYLETRPDIDTAKIAVMGASWGGIWTSIIPAIEERLKAAIMVVSGFAGCPTIEDMDKYKVSEFDQINFVKRVKIPVLMLSGKYDVFYSYEFTVRPMFELLGTPPSDKKLMVYETDHFVPYKDLVKETLDWLDKYLGPVNR